MFDPVQMSWLPSPGEGFRDRVKAVSGAQKDAGQTVADLATHNLTERETLVLSRRLAKLRAEAVDLSPLANFNLSVLSNCTVDLILDALPVAGARHHLNLSAQSGEFGQVLQEAMDPNSAIFAQTPDAILLMLDHRWYGRAGLQIDVDGFVARAMEKLTLVLDALEQSSAGKIQLILQTIAAPPGQVFGSFDRSVGGTMRDIDALNSAIVALGQERGCALLDVATLAETVGTGRFHDPVAYSLYKLPFAPEIAPLFCDWIARLLAAARGKSRKCLVLDLDNTLWGGAIGDEGLEGIILGQGSAVGEAFVAIQSFAKALKERGIILAVCSKNTDAVARRAFQEHPEMILKEDDIAVFQANWHDKASNIEAIASALNIGVDALVFLDDNPVERATVRQALPMVAVPEVGHEPADYLATLGAAGYFEALSFSDEDALRAQSYASNARRLEVKATARDLGDYLASLEMKIAFRDFNKIDRPRLVQLINKTNQFNLTTRRYTEAAVIEMETSDTVQGRYCRLKDRFGDFGIIGITITRTTAPEQWDIDTWLMSCRVLGREVEAAMLHDLVTRARAQGITTLRASFAPTQKNAMVANLYDRLGFERTSGAAGEAAEFQLDVATFAGPVPSMTIT